VVLFWFQGDYIWIEPVSGHEFDVAIGARVVSAEGRRIQVKDDDGKVSPPTPLLPHFHHILTRFTPQRCCSEAEKNILEDI